MKKIMSLAFTDFYKINHKEMYPKDTTLIFSNFTPRKSRMPGVNHSIFFGMKYLIEEYLECFHYDNFVANKWTIAQSQYEYTEFMKATLGSTSNFDNISDLGKLGHLPVAIYALPEGAIVPCGTPAFVIHNTRPKFAWVTNMLETMMSNILWGASTCATVARQYRLILDEYAEKTSDMPEFVDYQAHDFSLRGMFGSEAAILAGMAHLQYFKGTDNIPAIMALKQFYGRKFEISSVPATEHSIMSAYGKENEQEAYRRLICDVYPRGVISIVSDTYDLWNVVGNILPALKDEILARDGKLVIRPDSGDPVEIICGGNFKEFDTLEQAEGWAEEETHQMADDACEGSDNCGDDTYSVYAKVDGKLYSITFAFEYNRHDKTYYFVDDQEFVESEEHEITLQTKGLIECLWDIFGGTINSKGFKQLDGHIGAIYGDSITIDRARDICERLAAKGFASTNIVFGIGSYSYQYITRDSLGWAMKATYAEINGEGREIFKDPKTDDGTKKSHKGLIKVIKNDKGEYEYRDQITWEEFHASDNELKLVFKDGISYL